jgi:hypothetical protein
VLGMGWWVGWWVGGWVVVGGGGGSSAGRGGLVWQLGKNGSRVVFWGGGNGVVYALPYALSYGCAFGGGALAAMQGGLQHCGRSRVSTDSCACAVGSVLCYKQLQLGLAGIPSSCWDLDAGWGCSQ